MSNWLPALAEQPDSGKLIAETSVFAAMFRLSAFVEDDVRLGDVFKLDAELTKIAPETLSMVAKQLQPLLVSSRVKSLCCVVLCCLLFIISRKHRTSSLFTDRTQSPCARFHLQQVVARSRLALLQDHTRLQRQTLQHPSESSREKNVQFARMQTENEINTPIQ